jgi:hypothetical protein
MAGSGFIQGWNYTAEGHGIGRPLGAMDVRTGVAVGTARPMGCRSVAAVTSVAPEVPIAPVSNLGVFIPMGYA